MELPDVATSDRFVTLHSLAFELEQLAEVGMDGDAITMRATVLKLREWRESFNRTFAILESATGDFGALDSLMDGTEGSA